MVEFYKDHIIIEAKRRTKGKVSFTFKGDVDTIESLEPSCSCIGVNKTSDSVDVYYSTGSVPVHLLLQGKNGYTKNVSVEVKFIDGTYKKLSLTIKVIN